MVILPFWAPIPAYPKDENLRAALDGDMSAIQRLTPVQSMMYFDRLIGFFSDVENPKVKEASNTDDIVSAQISKQTERDAAIFPMRMRPGRNLQIGESK